MRAVVLLVTLVALLAGVPLAVGATFGMSAPILGIGDAWTYDVRGPGGNATIRVDVVDDGERMVSGTIVRIWEVRTQTAASAETSWHRAPDHAVVARERADGEPAWVDPPCRPARYPLLVGLEWRDECGDGISHAMVVARRNVTVVAGTFDALLVEVRRDGAAGERAWYAPAACGLVRRELADGTVWELASWSCASPAGFADLDRVVSPQVPTCSSVPFARCTPAPGALAVVVLLAVGALAWRSRRERG